MNFFQGDTYGIASLLGPATAGGRDIAQVGALGAWPSLAILEAAVVHIHNTGQARVCQTGDDVRQLQRALADLMRSSGARPRVCGRLDLNLD